MLHESEKEGKSDLFIAAMRFLLPLFASNHATKYVSLVADLLVDWFCSSDAEKIIYANAIFTRKTKNGANIFTDRYFEWMVRDLRIWLGKFTTLHHHTLVREVAATLIERKKQKAEGTKNDRQGGSSGGFNSRATDKKNNIPIDHSFCEVLAFCLDTNLWGSGPINDLKAGPYLKRQRSGCHQQTRMETIPERREEENGVDDDETAFKSLPGKAMNPEVLFCVSTGTEQGEDYFDTYLKENGDWFDHT